jgi:hypothetical protein
MTQPTYREMQRALKIAKQDGRTTINCCGSSDVLKAEYDRLFTTTAETGDEPDAIDVPVSEILVEVTAEPVDQPQQPHKPDSDPDESAPIDLWEQVVSTVARHDKISAETLRRFCSGSLSADGQQLTVTLSSPALHPVILSRLWLVRRALMELGLSPIVELIDTEPDTGSPPAVVPQTPPKPGTGGECLKLPHHPYTA